MEKPAISVVVPVFNVAPYVERCIHSIIAQSYPAAECIIVEDASLDDSFNICLRLIDGYSGPTKFIILHHQQNRVLSAARNTGTDAATGDYIYYVDSDDELTPDCLEKLIAPVLNNDDIEMVMGGHVVDYTALHGLCSWLLGKRRRFVKGG